MGDKMSKKPKVLLEGTEKIKKGDARRYGKKRLLELSFQEYQMLKEDEEYKLQWDSLEKLEKELRNKCRKGFSDDEVARALMSVTGLSRKIKEKWHLSKPISPYLKLKKEDLFKPIRPKSSLAKFFYAFGMSAFLPKDKHNKNKVISKQRREMEKRIKQFQCYMMHKKGKGFREIGRYLNISKDTAQNWNEEVKNWSEDYKERVFEEFLTSKPISDTDAYVSEESKEIEGEKYIKVQRPKNLQSIDEIDYAITDKGLYTTGKKKRHKPSDKED